MNAEAIAEDHSSSESGMSADAYRQHVIDVIWRYASRGGKLDAVRAFHELKDVTGSSYNTVKNWMHFGNALPNVEALSLIVAHWGISPEELFPQRVPVAVDPPPKSEGPPAQASHLSNEPHVLPIFGRSGARAVTKMFAKYSGSPTRCVWVLQPNGDAAGVVDQGEVMLVDPQIERIAGAGLYILRYPVGAHDDQLVTRWVQPLARGALAQISLPNTKIRIGVSEEVPLNAGELGHGIAVMGKVLAVTRVIG